MSLTVWTVGHSTRPLPDFLEVLAGFQIELIADVRRFPGSRSQPQYQQLPLESALRGVGVGYAWLPHLGGRRRPVSDPADTTWRHPAFHGYADHMTGEEFADGLVELLALAWGLRTAVMCAEVLWWRCHRRVIADVLVSLGYEVIHILDSSTTQLHRLRPPAYLVGGELSYSRAPLVSSRASSR
ncbi:MAG TPA: DUF488 domain-containing protein [Gemmatimonadales bacterium]|nr:DUF488 domain-containing protein [Gemmatimonadales bacterium]